MTIDEFISTLEAARDQMGGGTEVRVVYQESWPLRGTIANVCIPEPEDDEPHCDEHICFVAGCDECQLIREDVAEHPEDYEPPKKDADRELLWLAVGSAPWEENPYGPRWAWGA